MKSLREMNLIERIRVFIPYYKENKSNRKYQPFLKKVWQTYAFLFPNWYFNECRRIKNRIEKDIKDGTYKKY